MSFNVHVLVVTIYEFLHVINFDIYFRAKLHFHVIFSDDDRRKGADHLSFVTTASPPMGKGGE